MIQFQLQFPNMLVYYIIYTQVQREFFRKKGISVFLGE